MLAAFVAATAGNFSRHRDLGSGEVEEPEIAAPPPGLPLALSTPPHSPKIRWLHIPKAGSTFGHTACYYSCAHSPFVQAQQPATNAAVVRPPASQPYANKCSCPDSLAGHDEQTWFIGGRATFGHVPIFFFEVGSVVALFRHPRSRVASSCRQHGWQVDTDAAYAKCMETHALGHGAVQTRLVAGEGCGGARGCNSASRLPAVSPTIVLGALARLPSAFLFIGVQEAWNEGISLFHRKLMPGYPIENYQLQNIYPSEGNSMLGSGESTLERQERVAAALSPNATAAMETDPDLIIYGRARQLFCIEYANERLGPAPPVCERGLSPVVTPDPQHATRSPPSLLGARAVLAKWTVNVPVNMAEQLHRLSLAVAGWRVAT